MSEEYYNRLIEAIQEWCISNDMHEVCFSCKEKCKNGYTRWGGQMPPDMYCDIYQDVEEGE